MNWLVALGEAAHFSITALRAAAAAFVKPALWMKPFYDVLAGSLPLAVVAGVAMGVVIWLHTRGVLERTGTGAAEFLPTFLAAAVLLELAPVGAGLILAARTGAKLGAELAAMKVSEQLDAMSLLGASPMKYLVGPRVLAASLAAPLVFVLIAALALGSGYVAETLSGPATWLRYSRALLEGVTFSEAVAHGAKTIVFGMLVALAGCWMGLRAGGGSEGVGRAATAGVVAAVLLVLLADIVMVWAIRLLIG